MAKKKSIRQIAMEEIGFGPDLLLGNEAENVLSLRRIAIALERICKRPMTYECVECQAHGKHVLATGFQRGLAVCDEHG